jgi:hypothetical protein
MAMAETLSMTESAAIFVDYKVGDQVIYSGRLCTVTELGLPDGEVRVAHVDAGGIEWSFDVRRAQLKILGYPKDLILDHMAIVGRVDKHREETERHMAALEVGDMFHEMFSFWIIIEELPADGRVVAVHSGKYLEEQSTFEWIPQEYPTAAAFRHAQSYKSIPGYTVMWARNYVKDRAAKDGLEAQK